MWVILRRYIPNAFELAAFHSILIGAREQRGRSLPAGPIPEGS